jgi:hypothetical protein
LHNGESERKAADQSALILSLPSREGSSLQASVARVSSFPQEERNGDSSEVVEKGENGKSFY